MDFRVKLFKAARTGIVVWALCSCVIAQESAVRRGSVEQPQAADFSSITREEVEMLIADVAKSNPLVIKRFREDPEMKNSQLENLRQLLAFASEAQRIGVADESTNKQELQNIRSEVESVNYDKELNKDKGPLPPFAAISAEQVKAFWEAPGATDRELEFRKFLDAKIALLKSSNPDMKDREVTDDEKTQAREFYAKVNITRAEYESQAAAGRLPIGFRKKVELQVKLQQAQYLARLMSEIIVPKTKVSDAEVAKYIADHAEFNTSAKRTKALDVLKRARSGEDFAKLADEFSEDPGNLGPGGRRMGGQYKDVTKGKMVAPFEAAALALEPGGVTPDLVETDYGYHIIKLDRKGISKGADGKPVETYDVRHILFMTGVKDPSNPYGREIPVKDYARKELETEKEKRVTDEMIARNKVSVPDDFTVPEITQQQIDDLALDAKTGLKKAVGTGSAAKPTAKKRAPQRRRVTKRRIAH